MRQDFKVGDLVFWICPNYESFHPETVWEVMDTHSDDGRLLGTSHCKLLPVLGHDVGGLLRWVQTRTISKCPPLVYLALAARTPKEWGQPSSPPSW